MLKHTHTRNQNHAKLSKKSVSFFIDLDYIEIEIASMLGLSKWSDEEQIPTDKELKKLTASKVEKRVLSSLYNSGVGYFDYYENMPVNETILKIIRNKAKELFPQLS